MEKQQLNFKTNPKYIEIIKELAEKEEMTVSKFMHKLLKANLDNIGRLPK